ncbi:ankyrin repeat-containing protein, partial [Tanacetum coccineum]
EVEQMVPSLSRKTMNNDGKTPQELFTEMHTDLVSRGEKWMKDTAAQCMVVATLIATIVFAAVFTLPGGYNQSTGIPFFIPKSALIVLVISYAISLMLSSVAVLMFLSILTSRYAEHDFLESLPKKLMFGMATLFLSIMTMMVTFSASFFVLYHTNLKWVPFIATGFAAFPVILFVILQFPLLKDVFYTTYRSNWESQDRMVIESSLISQNPRHTGHSNQNFVSLVMYDDDDRDQILSYKMVVECWKMTWDDALVVPLDGRKNG